MAAPPSPTFGSFRLDLETEKLLRGDEVLRLGPKAFAVLRMLVERRGEVVRRAELLRAVWPETHVTPAVLKVAILEIRRALGDEAAAPRFVETVPRLGYRFLATASAERQTPARAQPLLGRGPALEGLGEHLAQARSGSRQIVFVAGEAGIGKTTLLETFVARVHEDDPDACVAWGSCLEHHGVAEAYLPLLEAVTRLCRARGGDRIVELLATYAPTWLASLPPALRGREVPPHELLGSTPERMLREMADALLALSEHELLVLVLEDLHWSDDSTIDLISLLSRRPDPARLLLLASYRPVDAALREHPLRGVVSELRARAACGEVALGYLSADDVAEYLTRRFSGHVFPAQLAAVTHRRTEGNPLFLVRLVDELLATASVVEREGAWRLVRPLAEVARIVPPTLGELIGQQVRRLDPDRQRVLEAASLVGRDFAAAAVAAALQRTFALGRGALRRARAAGLAARALAYRCPAGRHAARTLPLHPLPLSGGARPAHPTRARPADARPRRMVARGGIRGGAGRRRRGASASPRASASVAAVHRLPAARGRRGDAALCEPGSDCAASPRVRPRAPRSADAGELRVAVPALRARARAPRCG